MTLKVIKSILVSQPKPENEQSPYLDLIKKYNLKIEFRKFFRIEGISAKEFRKDRVNILDFTAIIFSSRNAVDHFFRTCAELRIGVPETIKYFCVTESTAYYLQKYIIYRKRKIFYGKQNFADLMDTIKKHKTEKFLVPCSEEHNQEISDLLEQNKITYSKAVIYRTAIDDLASIFGSKLNFDMLVFFSPIGIKSLLINFPKFVQGDIKICAFGATTAKAVTDAGLRLDVMAPTPQAPSMTMALDQFLAKANKTVAEKIQKKETAAKKIAIAEKLKDTKKASSYKKTTSSSTSTKKKPVTTKKIVVPKKPAVKKKPIITKKSSTIKKKVIIKKAESTKKPILKKKAISPKKSVAKKKIVVAKKPIIKKKATPIKKSVVIKKKATIKKVASIKKPISMVITTKKKSPIIKKAAIKKSIKKKK